MKNIFLSMTLTKLLASFNVFSSDDCSSANDDADVNSCSLQQKKNAEVELNKEYSEAKKRLAVSFDADKKLLNEYLTLLLESQRGWLKYRDAQCKIESFMADESTPVYESINDSCIARLDKGRTAQLKNMPYE
ncbi:MAG: lysozyme inhibitor LprI family protein [Mixta calida]|uniref:DUF1311 domain-containing protein n=1 Tax=Mixta calida TaxID=665913 RepID=A0ABM6RY02_9GAMM|nr:lysozyme inhibitor LprI family protein [Mixta calida]MDU3816653.1 lysozyme inhibitor LprI family protein [Pantoea sp.]AUY24091.1 DUF1311 domain-containing protein [Mixta calida]KAF0858206.1 hypothetical protein Y888_17665 [Mixta calida B021323]MDU2732904.1 lysozyme inhibitor LprI family protein [Mixta calida]ORM58017.1 hypothetical protein HA40_12315 [Mixta calida]